MQQTAAQSGFLSLGNVRAGNARAQLADGLVPTITLQQLHQLAQADPKLTEHFGRLPVEAQDSLRAESEGPATATPAPPQKFVAAGPIDGADIREADGRPVACFSATPFENWGRTVSNVPAVTYVPTTKAGVCSIVQSAGKNGQRVRVAVIVIPGPICIRKVTRS